jgi:spore coat-associated protein N
VNLTRTQKVLLSVAAVGGAAGLAGLGTFAAFSDTDTGTQQISAGTVDVNLATGAGNRLSVVADGLVPGDSVQRRVRITNSGSENLAALTLTTEATTSSTLNTDTTNGLQMKIEKCAGALGWSEQGTGPYTYTCDQASAGDDAGSRTTVLARRPIIGSGLALANISALTAGGSDDMVVTADLPTAAPNSMQGQSSVVQYTFNATQRAGTAQ